MKTGLVLIKRNVKLFFKDKGMFFTSLITPVILLVLYISFLGKVYRDGFSSALPEMLPISDRIIDALVGGQLMSSILAVSCVTVSFCSNFLMVQDKATGTIKDLSMSPVRGATLSIAYYAATLISTMLICFVATGVCLAYVALSGWYMSISEVALLFLDVCLLVLFGTALSSLINLFLSTQGQISAVGTIISAGYGFLCGAYMPISSFGSGLKRLILLLPGTYGTALLRKHSMGGALNEMGNQGVPAEVIEGIKDTFDCKLYFSGKLVDTQTMYIVLCGTIVLLVAAFILINTLKRKGKNTA